MYKQSNCNYFKNTEGFNYSFCFKLGSSRNITIFSMFNKKMCNFIAKMFNEYLYGKQTHCQSLVPIYRQDLKA